MTITGSGFTGATDVGFGPPARRDERRSATPRSPPPPPGGGTVDITVTTPAGTSPTSPADQFTYTGAAPAVTAGLPHLGAAGGTP